MDKGAVLKIINRFLVIYEIYDRSPYRKQANDNDKKGGLQ
jgi:hypothetical protein